ncbi:Por secretion system C-terminal sorting domain-containing protein [Chryseolinea serpens]|uniref:Por secretion system C-terminal sorting domain-containing protein n=1 Tax=Chryseolinea serpens TaxID=947013 RepID=A0A1M5QTZ1_9BACT|nr:MBG domain-containing protein [Chryseolinea serpens]SHH17542.1 Por secretion system C-terminal sorting domain-containing protein [Chryseolinea serpens]
MKTILLLRNVLIVVFATALSTDAWAQFWEAAEGPYGGSITAALVTTDGTYFGGSGTGYVYRKLPGSDKWEIVFSVTAGSILDLHEYNGTVYVSYAGEEEGTLSVSKDGGTKWEREDNGLPGMVRDMTVNDNGDLFAATTEGIYKRTPGKGGSINWELRTIPTDYGNYIFSICNDHKGTLFAGAGRGLFRSDDDGETWTLSAFYETANAIMSLAVNANGDVYAGTGDTGLQVNYAADGEPNTWVPVAADLMGTTQIRQVDILKGNEIFVSVTFSGSYYSSDGVNFNSLTTRDSRAGSFYDPFTDQLVVGTDEGFWTAPYVKDNFQFVQIGVPLNINRLFSYQSKLIAMVDNNKIYSSNDQGKTWTYDFGNGEGVVTSYAEKDNLDIFVGCKGGLAGTPWVNAKIFIEYLGERDWWNIGFPREVRTISDILVTSKDSVYIGTNAGLYMIDSKFYASSQRSVIGEGVSILYLKEDAGGNLYAGTNQGVYISSDDGLHWQTHVLEDKEITDLVVREGHLYAATLDGLFYLETPDATPQQIAVGGKGSEFTAVATDDLGHVYAVSPSGVFYAESEDTWQSEISGIENHEYKKLVAIDNLVYVSTNLGIYKHAYADYAAINLSNVGTFTYNGAPHAATATTTPAGLSVTLLYDGEATPPVEGGSYQVTAIVNGPNYAGRKKARIVIEKAEASIALTGLGTHYYSGNPFPVTAVTTPAGLPVTITYNDGAEVPKEIGEYYVIATIDHRSYKGQVSGDLLVQDPIMSAEDPLNKFLSVYPVPAREQLTIESQGSPIRSILVTDIMGKRLSEITFNTPVVRHVLDTRQLSAGLLVFRITTDKNEKIIKRGEIIR